MGCRAKRINAASHFCVHSLTTRKNINLLYTAIVLFYNKIDAIKGIKSIVFIYLIQLVSELINVAILKLINIDLEVLSMDGLYKTVLGLPSLVITGVIVLIVYKIKNRKEAK